MAKGKKNTGKKANQSSDEERMPPSPKGKGKGKGRKRKTQDTPPASPKGKSKKMKTKAELKVVVRRSPRKKPSDPKPSDAAIVAALVCAASTVQVPPPGVFVQSDVVVDSQQAGGSGLSRQAPSRPVTPQAPPKLRKSKQKDTAKPKTQPSDTEDIPEAEQAEEHADVSLDDSREDPDFDVQVSLHCFFLCLLHVC